MANQRIKANLIPSCDIYPVIHLAQYDVSDGTGKQVEIELYYGTDKFTIPSGSSITFRGTKRDKTGYSYEITKFTDNVVTVDVKPQMTVLSGTHFAELRISKGNTISNTIKFVMKIDSSALADDTKVSETDLSVIEKALQASDAAIQAKAEVEQLKASVEKSEKNAKQSETNASQSATNAQESAESASTSATNASTSATKAKESEKNAKLSETNASNSANEAQKSAESAIQTKAEVEQLKKETVEQTKTLTDSAKQEISTVKDATVTEVAELKNSTVSEITSLKDSTIEAVTLLKDNAKAEADKAKESETNAKLSETNASNSAKEAKESAESVATVTSDVEKLKEDLPNKISKFYASNQGETHITDSDNGKIQDMMIYGKSNQNQTKGKNLLKYPYIETTKTSNGITFTDNKDGSINVSGTGTETAYYNFYSNSDGKRLTLASGTYKLVAKGRSKCNVFVNNGVNSAKNEGTFTITDGHNDTWCFIEAPKGLAINETIYPMIQLASSTDESYEPYTGGKPSPNPDYPQEIKNVVNPTIKVAGKNLWKIYENGYINNINGNIADSNTKTYGVTDFIKIKKNIVIQSKSYDKTSNAAFSFRIGFYDSEKKWIKNATIQGLQNSNIVDIGSFHISKAEYIRVSAPNTIFDDLQIEYGTQASEYEPYKEQSIALPITLNAIPVSSGGNVTIDGQQYIADRVVEKDGVFGIERNIREIHTNTKTMNNREEYPGWDKVKGISDTVYYNEQPVGAARTLTFISNFTQSVLCKNNIKSNNIVFFRREIIGYSQSELITKAIDVDMYIRLQDAIFEPLPEDIQAKLRTLVTNYPVTNISVTSDQLDGYTVFNYPISMANGWNYVKKQLNDNRDYIYDMDLQSAEAYVNSEYAVTLTELEV